MDDHADYGLPEILEQHGLEGPAFDLSAIADGLAAWRGAARELDRLLEDQAVEYATTFEPEWR